MYIRACDDESISAWPDRSNPDRPTGECRVHKGQCFYFYPFILAPYSLETFSQTFFSEASNEQKIVTLRKACNRHVGLTKECSQGLGQDRLVWEG